MIVSEAGMLLVGSLTLKDGKAHASGPAYRNQAPHIPLLPENLARKKTDKRKCPFSHILKDGRMSDAVFSFPFQGRSLEAWGWWHEIFCKGEQICVLGIVYTFLS